MNVNNTPKISVIMSVFNGEKYLKEAVESILNQTYSNFEFIILNDASTDNTKNILLEFDDPRIIIIENFENLGLTRSLNKALKLARGEYIARMDADDISHPLRFEKQVNFLDRNKKCLVVGTFMCLIDDNGRKYGVSGQYEKSEDIKNRLLIQNEIGHGSTMLRRLALEQAGYYNENFLYAQDYDLWLRLSEIGELNNLPEELYSLRYCQGCISIDKQEIQAKYAALAQADAFNRISKKISKNNNKLSLVHINTHDVAGGAAKVAWRLAEAQRNAGHNAKMLVGGKMSKSEHSFAFPVEVNPQLHAQCYHEGQLFYEFQGSHRLVNHPLVQSADILHLHNLHGWYFNPFSISVLSHLKPIVWTLHDMQSFTGHCAHSFDCEKWQTGCGECPYLNVEAALTVDTSAQLWKDKKLIYDNSYLWIVTPSDWMKKKVERSILKNQHVSLIYNGIDISIFKPYSKLEIKRSLGLPDDAIIIGTAAHGGISNQWKGGNETQQALDTLLRRHQNLVFLNIGGTLPNTDNRFINTGHIEDESIIAQFYSCLDIFIYTPVADNCPLTILEALACGIPIVTFDTGGIPELVHDGAEGFVIKNRNIDDLILATDKLIDNHTTRDTYSKNARERAVSTFDHHIIAGRYEKLYEQYLGERRIAPRETRLFPVSSLPPVIITPDFIAAENKKSTIHQELQTEGTPDVSIIIATKDRAQLLDQMLTSLKKASEGVKYEIIVIEGNSTDNTQEILRKHGVEQIYSEKEHFTEGKHSWAQLYNFGFSKARGKWGMYASDDIVFHDSCVTRAVEMLNQQSPVVAGGIFFYRNIAAEPAWKDFGIDFIYGQKLLLNYGLIKLDYFREVSGLNEDYIFYHADSDFCLKLYKTGKQLIPLPESFITHINTFDIHKRNHFATEPDDMRLYISRWSHFVQIIEPIPRRLIWEEALAGGFLLPSYLPILDAGIEYFWHGLSLYQQGNFEEAAIKFHQTVKTVFGHWIILWYLGNALLKTGSLQEASEVLQKVIHSAPFFTPAADLLSTISERSISEQGELLKRLQNNFRDVPALIRLADIELNRSNKNKAMNYLIAATALEPENSEAKALMEKLQN